MPSGPSSLAGLKALPERSHELGSGKVVTRYRRMQMRGRDEGRPCGWRDFEPQRPALADQRIDETGDQARLRLVAGHGVEPDPLRHP